MVVGMAVGIGGGIGTDHGVAALEVGGGGRSLAGISGVHRRGSDKAIIGDRRPGQAAAFTALAACRHCSGGARRGPCRAGRLFCRSPHLALLRCHPGSPGARGGARGAERGGAAAAFHAGAALAHLQDTATERASGVPLALQRDRLALGAAAAGLMRAGARALAGDLRDRLCFLPAGAAMDPATARLVLWRRAGRIRLRGGGLARMLAEVGGGNGGVDGGGSRCGAAADLVVVVEGSGDWGRCKDGGRCGDGGLRAGRDGCGVVAAEEGAE